MSDPTANLALTDPTEAMQAKAASSTGSLLDDVAALMTQAESFTGDIISTGGQITLRAGHETIMPLGNDQTWIHPGDKMGLLRAQYRDQGGMMVLTINISVFGEKVGVIGAVSDEHPQGERIPLPAYKAPGWATWWGWVHMINTEFMNPNPEMVEIIRAALANHPNYQVYKPRNRPGQPTRERTATILWDFEPKGDDLPTRHTNGLAISKAVLLPDKRDEPLVTSYMKGDEKVVRPGFTGFVDVIMHNTRAQMAAQALPADHPDRANIQRTANSRLSLLTGTDERDENGYSLRPTIGQLQLVAPAKGDDESDEDYATRIEGMNKLLGGTDLSLFPIKESTDEVTEGVPASPVPSGQVSYANADPFASQAGEPQPEPDI